MLHINISFRLVISLLFLKDQFHFNKLGWCIYAKTLSITKKYLDTPNGMNRKRLRVN